jgi:hypothetical protein
MPLSIQATACGWRATAGHRPPRSVVAGLSGDQWSPTRQPLIDQQSPGQGRLAIGDRWSGCGW